MGSAPASLNPTSAARDDALPAKKLSKTDTEILRRIRATVPEALEDDPTHPFEKITEAILDADPEAVADHHTRRKQRLKRAKARRKR